MQRNICVIGIGSLGGYLARNLSELETTKNLLLIDYDTVERENLRNSRNCAFLDPIAFLGQGVFHRVESASRRAVGHINRNPMGSFPRDVEPRVGLPGRD